MLPFLLLELEWGMELTSVTSLSVKAEVGSDQGRQQRREEMTIGECGEKVKRRMWAKGKQDDWFGLKSWNLTRSLPTEVLVLFGDEEAPGDVGGGRVTRRWGLNSPLSAGRR